MASTRHLKPRIGRKGRPGPAAFNRPLGKGCGDIKTRQGFGRRCNLARSGERNFSQFFQMRGFGGQRMGAGLRHLDRQFMQLRRVEADDAGQRLAVGKA